MNAFWKALTFIHGTCYFMKLRCNMSSYRFCADIERCYMLRDLCCHRKMLHVTSMRSVLNYTHVTCYVMGFVMNYTHVTCYVMELVLT